MNSIFRMRELFVFLFAVVAVVAVSPSGAARELLAERPNASEQNVNAVASPDIGDSNEALDLVRNGRANVKARRAALRSLVAQRNPKLPPILRSLLADRNLRIDAIRAMGVIEDDRAPEALLSLYGRLGLQGKRAVLETLASRKKYATSLLSALKKNAVPRKDLPVYLARSLATLLGERFTSWYGDVRRLSEDKAESIRRLKALLTPERLARADAGKGGEYFRAVCAGCHPISGGGGRIGPDLLGFNRANIDFLLLNITDPSADIAEGYKLAIIDTKDGQFLAGTIAREDGQSVVLNLARQRQTVLKSDIVSRKFSDISMMPEGLLAGLPDDLALGFVKFLQTAK